LLARSTIGRALRAKFQARAGLAALSWIPAGGGQEPPLNNTLIEVEPE